MPRKLTQEEFIQKANNVHRDGIYDYALVRYNNCRQNIDIICTKHKVIFTQRADAHLGGRKCRLCSDENVGNALRGTLENFLSEAIKTHGDKYNYDFVKYYNAKTKVDIFCKSCNDIFRQTPYHHTADGAGCPYCSNHKIGKYNSLAIKNPEIATEWHTVKNGILTPHQVTSGSAKKVWWICLRDDSHIWEATIVNRTRCKNGCPYCVRHKMSKGEMEIRKLLENIGIDFTIQKKFEKCKNKRSLPFDFYLPNNNMCIEYNGKQHYAPIECFGGIDNFVKIQKNDEIKKEFCKINNIELVIIKYNEDVTTILNMLLINKHSYL